MAAQTSRLARPEVVNYEKFVLASPTCVSWSKIVMEGVDRMEARFQIASQIERVLSEWSLR